MNIIIGRGNNRKTYELPCADIIKRADKNGEHLKVMALRDNVCALLGIDPRMRRG